MDVSTLAVALGYTKKQIEQAKREGFKVQVEQDRNILETTGEEKIFYFLPKNPQKPKDGYDEFVYVNNNWEQVGVTDIDLSAYALKSEIPTKVSQLQNDSRYLTEHQDISGKADKATTLVGYGITDGQQKIGSDNKLLSDLVDDSNQTNKFVTTSEKTTWGEKYDKPNSGIPKTDLSEEVQISLGKANTALQSHQDISGKADKATTLSGYGITDAYTKTEVDTKLSAVYKYKGTVVTYQDLPSSDLTNGDVYNVETDDSNYAWTGSAWDKLGGNVDLSGYQTKIDSSHKLFSDLIDDTNNTNKFVTSNEKTVWGAKYDKPNDGIPSTDLSAAVQTSLGKADTALQSYTEQYTGTVIGITMNGNSLSPTDGVIDLGTVITAHQDISGKADKATTLAGYGITDGETTSHKVTAVNSSASDTQYPSAKAVYQVVSTVANNGEVKANKVTAIGSSSTDTQYPSAKAVYNAIQTAIGGVENGSY